MGRDEHGRDHWWPSETKALGSCVSLTLDAPVRFRCGGSLDAVEVSYESWGDLNAARDNVVLIVHPMTTDCHVTGEAVGQPMGWWEGIVGPGRAIDTDRCFVVCPNLVGGCYGTTGPGTPTGDGAPYGERFPLTTPRDMMQIMKCFLHELGIERVACVVGPSMGGMIAWEFATDDLPEGAGAGTPDAVRADEVVIVAAPPWASPLEIGWNRIQREGLELDARLLEVMGDGGSRSLSRKGYRIARSVGMLSYRAPEGLIEKFGREWLTPPGETLASPGVFTIESWLAHHGKRLAKRFDPLTYRLYARAMDLHDVREGRKGKGTGGTWGARGTARVLGVGISSDQLYPSIEVRRGVEALAEATRDATYAEIQSANGHDAFLLDVEQLSDILGDWRRD